MNRALVCGNLGKDPELRYTKGGTAVCNFSVATKDREKAADGQWKDVTDWHNILVWGKIAENCAKYLSKGRQVLVEGKMRTSNWEDQNGNRRYKTEIVASNVQFIGGQPQGYEKREDGVETRTRRGGGKGMAEDAEPESDPWSDGLGSPDLDSIPF